MLRQVCTARFCAMGSPAATKPSSTSDRYGRTPSTAAMSAIRSAVFARAPGAPLRRHYVQLAPGGMGVCRGRHWIGWTGQGRRVGSRRRGEPFRAAALRPLLGELDAFAVQHPHHVETRRVDVDQRAAAHDRNRAGDVKGEVQFEVDRSDAGPVQATVRWPAAPSLWWCAMPRPGRIPGRWLASHSAWPRPRARPQSGRPWLVR
jgi:hypothetical protein